jgi:hypothetical protein
MMDGWVGGGGDGCHGGHGGRLVVLLLAGQVSCWYRCRTVSKVGRMQGDVSTGRDRSAGTAEVTRSCQDQRNVLA